MPIPGPWKLTTVDLTGLTAGNTYYYRVKATNSQPTDWADQTASFKSESSINLSSGTLFFNTSGPTPTWLASDGTEGNGELQTLSWTDASSNTIQYKVAKFSFTNVNIGGGVAVNLAGDNPIHLDISGDATINAALDANGSHGNTGYLTTMVGGNLGGGEGGLSFSGGSNPAVGTGPTHLIGSSTFNSVVPVKGWYFKQSCRGNGSRWGEVMVDPVPGPNQMVEQMTTARTRSQEEPTEISILMPYLPVPAVGADGWPRAVPVGVQ